MRGGGVFQYAFAHGHGCAIGRDGMDWRGFRNRRALRRAIDRRRRRKNEPLHPGLYAGVEQVERVGGVVAVIIQRAANGFRHQDRAGEMNDVANGVLGEHALERRRAPHISLNKGCALRRQPARARGQIVERDGFFSCVFQRKQHVRPDIAGAASHQYAHVAKPLMSPARSCVSAQFTPLERDSLSDF